MKLGEKPELIVNALSFFDKTFIPETQQWFPISSEINKSPRAPWWNFDEDKARSDESWGNPTVEIIGYIAKYGSIQKYQEVFKKVVRRLKSKANIETHELQCYLRLYKALPDNERIDIEEDLFRQIKDSVEVDPTKWEGYVTTPLTFVDSPDSSVFSMFESTIPMQLDMLIDSQAEDGAWWPSWEWGTYPEIWENVKVELAGLITTSNLILLDKFKRNYETNNHSSR